jgi:hypothetical protein
MGKAVDVNIPLESWDDERGDRQRLKTTLFINGVGHHLEAIAVEEDAGSGVLCAASPKDNDALEAIAGVYETRWSTVFLRWPRESRARHYVVYAVPFGD